MTQVFRTIIVTADQAPLARQLCAGLAGPEGEGMFGTPCFTGADETHYISSGYIAESMAALLADPAAIVEASQLPAEVIDALLAGADITEEGPFEALARLGLALSGPDAEMGEP